jgi:hypothetical protein
MKTKTILSFFVIALIALVAVNSVMATLPVSIDEVQLNEVVMTSGVNTLAGAPSETIPVVVKIVANANLTDVKLKVYIEGYKADIYVTTSRFDVIAGSTYIKRLALTLPSVEDMDGLTEGLTLRVRVADKSDDVENVYSIGMQRDAYSLGFLSVDTVSQALAGEIVPVNVVLKNIGTRLAEDTFVSVVIPELGISKKAYFADLYAEDNSGDNQDDARERTVYVMMPSDAKSGDYTIQVTASNYDSSATVKKLISISGTTAASNSTNTGTNVIKPTGDNSSRIPTSIVVLTVALVIIFVVLLIVLIVLLTKRPSEKSEDFGETSYY